MAFAYELKDVKLWLVEFSADGSHDSFLVKGGLEDVANAFKREQADEYIEELMDVEHYWTESGFYLDLEQAYIRVTPVRRTEERDLTLFKDQPEVKELQQALISAQSELYIISRATILDGMIQKENADAAYKEFTKASEALKAWGEFTNGSANV